MFHSSRQNREQSLSHRGPKTHATLSKRIAWGSLLKKVAIDLGIGTASTVAGYTALDAITGPNPSPAPASAGAVPVTSGAPPGAAGPSVQQVGPSPVQP